MRMPSTLRMAYHLHLGGQDAGSHTAEEVRARLAAGEATLETLVWKEGAAEWVPLRNFPELISAPAAAGKFEQAEFEEAAAGQPACAACKAPIVDAYYELNGHMVCANCKDRAEAPLEGSGAARFGRALAAGGVAAALGAGIWFAILKFTGYEFGLVAIIIGLMVGGAVRWGARARGGWLYQGLAMVLTYTSIVSTYVPLILAEIKPDPAPENPAAAAAPAKAGEGSGGSTDTAAAAAETPAPAASARGAGLALVGVAILLAFAFAAPFLAGFQNIIGLVIIGIGLYEAWKINKRAEVAVTGPYRLGKPGPAVS